jgi:vacuolar-type H+-ATPase subunit I/STV1
MKRFYLAVPVEFEEATLRKIVELGVIQLTRDIPIESAEKNESVEILRKFVRLYERINHVLADAKAEGPKEESVREIPQLDLSMVKSFSDKTELKLDDTVATIERLEKEIKDLRIVQERLGFLETNELKTDEIGKFPHIFVKTGFMMSTALPKLSAYVGGTSVVFIARPGRPRENFLIITGLNEDEALTEMILKLLNFEQFYFPQGFSPEPNKALQEVNDAITSKEKNIQTVKADLIRLRMEFDSYELYVSTNLRIEEAKGLVARTKRKCLIHGWIPTEKTQILRSKIEEVVPADKIYLKFEDPKPEDKVPVEIKNKGVLNSFAVFTNLQGVPNYFEVNPTPIYAVLYVIMFGMMFGDVGTGGIFVIVGFLLTRLRKGLFVFSKSATHKLGQILVFCGVVAVFFGFLYGEFFLTEITRPILFKPINNMAEISIIALVFGVGQIVFAMVLNTINNIRKSDRLGAVFSSRGVIGLTYYSAGIILAIAFINKMSFNVFLEQGIYIFTAVALLSLVLIFLSPTIKAFARRTQAGFTETLIEGFGEGLETLIVLIANSVSYIRLAAFAIAHGALGLAAVIFTPIIGGVPSFIIMNIIVFVIEGFAALIQSLRLMYYEFSTKFYVDGGVQYKPFKIIRLRTNI